MASYLFVHAMFGGKNDCKKNAERIYRNRTAPLDLFDDAELVNRYRLSRRAIQEVIELCRPELERATQRSRALNPDLQVLITLRYLGKGGFQSELADLHGVSQPTVSRAIGTTVDILSRKLDRIRFPKDATSQREVKQVFHALAGFPNVLGCIDGTLIAIVRPQACEEAAYVCRKGFHAVNIQAICDGDLRFTNVVCRWPGATHDSYIFNNSTIGSYLEESGGRNGWLLEIQDMPADHGWSPLSHPQTQGEERFN
ncbi:putative nuclease HARBI1 [Haliotis rubra]|uniref:putative nuclease HARBI1 n=1 Tax=Haliotis rubra TaxID=36100 RepID=UPI001EE4EF02|nr:putative nuclease HARBI1 [Haliotis rubra]